MKRNLAVGRVAHAERVVDHEDMADPARAPQPILEARRIQERTSEKHEQQDGQRDSYQEQDQLFDLDPPPIALDGELQIRASAPIPPVGTAVGSRDG